MVSVTRPRGPAGPNGTRPRGPTKASFKPPSRTSAAGRSAEGRAASKEGADLPADPAGQALCDNMRELTAHLRGIYHSISDREDPDPEDRNVEGHPLVALCDSMRELTAQLRGIFHNLKHEDADGHELGAMKQRHPLVASLAESLHREALRMLEDGPSRGKAREVHSAATAPNGTATERPKVVAFPAPKLERQGSPGCASPNSDRQPSRSFGGRRTRPRPRPASPRDNLARKRAASRESGPERLKRLGLVGIPKAEKVEAAQPPSQRSCSEPRLRASSKKASDLSEKKANKAKMEAETRRQVVSPSEAKTTRLKAERVPNENRHDKTGTGEEEELRRPQAGGVAGAVAVPRPTSTVQEKSKQREESASRKRGASRSGPERPQRLGAKVAHGMRKDEATPSGTRRLTRKAPAEVEETRAPAQRSSGVQNVRTVRQVPSKAPTQLEAIAPESAETERGPPPAIIQESDSMGQMDEDVRRMLEWAAAEAAHTRRVAARVANVQGEGVAHYSVARIRETNQGRLANRLRAATLNRARQARQAMQDLFFDGVHQDGFPFRTPGMVPQEVPWGRIAGEAQDDRLEETEDEELSQADEERESSYLTEADRQRIGEVLAEQERRRAAERAAERAEQREAAGSPAPAGRNVGTMWPTFSPGRRPPVEVPWPSGSPGSQSDGHRPPSRGGESWQPLGQTTPPAYEQVTPELLQLWQIQEMQLHPSEQVAQEDAQEDELPVDQLPAEASSHGTPEVHGSPDDHPGTGHELPDAIDPSAEVPEGRTEGHEDDFVEPHLGETEDAESEVYSEGVESDASEVQSAGDLPSRDSENSSAPFEARSSERHSEEPARGLEPAKAPSEEGAPPEVEVASVHSSEDLGHFEEVEVTESGGFQADEWIVEVSPSQAASSKSPASRFERPADAATVHDITEEVVAVIMEELINDTVQSSAAAAAPEPALWHPTPVAPPFIDIFSEDNAPDGSSAESEPVVQPSPRRPLPTAAVPSSGKPVVPPVGPALAPAANTSSHGEELEGRQSKDGPPRPPSPPPDARSLATVPTAPNFQSSTASASPPRPKGKQEQADLISQELLEMLLGEALQEYEGAAGGAASASATAGATAGSGSGSGTAFQSASPVEEARVSIGSSGPSPLVAGPKPIDTSEAVVGPFVDAAFQHFGVVDETQPVAGPVPPVEEWFPSVLEIMRSKATSTEETEESELPEEELQRQRAAVEGFTRLLADALLEIASEEVKEQGPRVMGWRRPCFGEAPLSRFREKQAEEKQTSSQKQTWEKVRAKLMELVRFGWRAEATEETGGAVSGPQGRMTIDLEAGPGALALANLDEGIDALLEEEICSDEASWLDIKADVQKVKNEVARMIFADLVEELANEIARLWSAPT